MSANIEKCYQSPLKVEGEQGIMFCNSEVYEQQYEKADRWEINLSAQHGCGVGCSFCGAPNLGNGANIPYADIITQIKTILNSRRDINYVRTLRIAFDMCGEASYNKDVLRLMENLYSIIPDRIVARRVEPIVSTICPSNNKYLIQFLKDFCSIKDDIYSGKAGLRFNVFSTNDWERGRLFNERSKTIYGIASVINNLPEPKLYKYVVDLSMTECEVDTRIINDVINKDKVSILLASKESNLSETLKWLGFSVLDVSEGYEYFGNQENIV